MAGIAAGVALGAVVCLVAAPYLAGLTRTVPDRDDARWWRPTRVSRARLATTAVAALLAGAAAGAAAGWSAALPAFVALALAGAPLAVIDLEHHRLPDRLVRAAAVAAAVLLAVAAAVEHRWPDYLRGIEAAAAVFAVLFLLRVISPRSFGYGDVKFGAVLGGYLGWRGWGTVYYGIFAAFLLGALIGVALLATRRAGRRTALPFGPMLLAGTLIVLAFDLAPSLTG